MSMTQPMTTLTDGQYAPLLLRSSPALRSTVPRCLAARQEFLRNDLRRGRADYFANQSLERTSASWPRCAACLFSAPRGQLAAPPLLERNPHERM